MRNVAKRLSETTGTEAVPAPRSRRILNMDRQEIKAKLQEIIAIVDEELAGKGEVKEAMQIREGLRLDSLQTVELLFEIEEQLGVKIEDEEVQKLKTVADLLDVIEQKLDAVE